MEQQLNSACCAKEWSCLEKIATVAERCRKDGLVRKVVETDASDAWSDEGCGELRFADFFRSIDAGRQRSRREESASIGGDRGGS